MAQLRQPSAEIYGCGRFADASFLVSDRDDFHFMPEQSLPDDVVARGKRKLNFSNFRFGISAVASKPSQPVKASPASIKPAPLTKPSVSEEPVLLQSQDT